MNKITKAIVLLTVCITLAGLTGCEPKEEVSDRQERLYAAQNMELQKQISELEEQFAIDIQKKQDDLGTWDQREIQIC